MAEGIAIRIVRERNLHFVFDSAGTLGLVGLPPTAEAIIAARERGADIEAHQSKALTPSAICAADFVIGMEYAHLESVKALCPSGKRAMLLDVGEIEDPIGKGLECYRAVALKIETRLEQILSELHNEKIIQK